jgi:hypothetical protein
VRAEKDGFILGLNFFDELPYLPPADRIKPGNGFVQKNQLGLINQGLGNADALEHAPGKSLHDGISFFFHADHFQEFFNPAFSGRRIQVKDSAKKVQELNRGQMRVKIGILRQKPDLFFGLDIPYLLAQDPGPAFGGFYEIEQDIYGRGFARAVGAEITKDIAGFYFHGQFI